MAATLLKYTRPWTLVLVVLLIYLSVIWLTSDRDTKAFVTIGSCFNVCEGNDGENCDIPDDAEPETVLDIEGYDGQFNFYMARDFDDAAPCIDRPAYRYQRVLLPVLGALFSLGTTEIIPWIFLLVNATALVISTRLLEDLLADEGRKRWFALSYGLFFGVVIAVRLSTSEPLAYGLVIGAIWAFQRGYSTLWVALLLGLAGLAKETTGIMTAGLLLWLLLQKRYTAALQLVAIAGGLFIAWQLYLFNWLGEFGLGAGGAKATGFEIIPFGGVFRIAIDGGLLVFFVLGVVLLGAPVILPSLWGLRESVQDFRMKDRPITLYTCIMLTTAGIMPFVPSSTYREYLGIFRFIPGLVLMVVLYSAERNLGRPLMYSTLWIVLLLFLSVG